MEPEQVARIVKSLTKDGREVHPYWCDCAGCWTGITVCAPKPPTVWQRIRLAVRSALKENDRGE